MPELGDPYTRTICDWQAAYEPMYHSEMSRFLAAVRGEQPWPYPPRASAVVCGTLAAAELSMLSGRVEPVGEIPRTGEPDPVLERVEQAFADKYTGGQVLIDGRHAWLRLVPEKITSWDFRKLPAARREHGG